MRRRRALNRGRLRVKDFRGEIFTLNVLCDRGLGGFGEGVKAKNEKSLCAHNARARGFLPSPCGERKNAMKSLKMDEKDEKTVGFGRKGVVFCGLVGRFWGGAEGELIKSVGM